VMDMITRRYFYLLKNLRINTYILEFFLCLSRACLGKMIGLIYKWRRKTLQGLYFWGCHFAATEIHQLAKTGSKQT
jgi:hypothetical protein